MNTSRIAFFLLTIAMAFPNANAQYAGTLPSETVTSHAADTAPAPSVQPGSAIAASIVAPIAPALTARPATRIAPARPVIEKSNSLYSVSPSSLRIAAPIARPVVTENSKNPIDRLQSMHLKPPAGSKKGHWVAAPIYSMSAMPTWVEDK